MHPNASLIQRFYKAFTTGDADKMVQCYHGNITFSDPVFGELQGPDAGRMWRMLIARSKGTLKITFNNIHADDTRGSAHWQAEYVFGAASRPVINRIHAHFQFKEGLIIRHDDNFDLWRWAGQAMGWKGLLLGWSPWFRLRLRESTRRLLDRSA